MLFTKRLKEEPTTKDGLFYSLAQVAAQTSSYHGTHVGVVLVYKGTPITVVINNNKEHPFSAEAYRNYTKRCGELLASKFTAEKFPPELMALCLALGKDIDWAKTSLYIYKIMKNGKVCASKPCDACVGLVSQLGMPYIVYQDNDGKLVKDHYFYQDVLADSVRKEAEETNKS